MTYIVGFVDLKDGETVCFGWTVWSDEETCNRREASMEEDPRWTKIKFPRIKSRFTASRSEQVAARHLSKRPRAATRKSTLQYLSLSTREFLTPAVTVSAHACGSSAARPQRHGPASCIELKRALLRTTPDDSAEAGAEVTLGKTIFCRHNRADAARLSGMVATHQKTGGAAIVIKGGCKT